MQGSCQEVTAPDDNWRHRSVLQVGVALPPAGRLSLTCGREGANPSRRFDPTRDGA